jgi:4-hydroxy-3-polyprenylbenzoate decarboxylase
MGEVIHAFASKCHPGRGFIIHQLEDGKANMLTPGYDREERRRMRGAAAFIDSTWPVEWPEVEVPIKSSFKTIYPKELQEKVLRDWKTYGL